MTRRGGNQESFWVAYSDLATGLMIVFMVVMLLMVVLSLYNEQDRQQQNDETVAEVERLVAELQIILGARSRLAEAIEAAVPDNVHVDPVTAQLSVPEEVLTFGTNKHTLQPGGKAFLRAFAPAYLCALWDIERQKGDELDPDRPQGVRRIMVTGNGDLNGGPIVNHGTGQARAFGVVEYVKELLDDCQGGDCPADIFVPARCRGQMDQVAAYGIQRLWAVSAGNTRHCIDTVFQRMTPAAGGGLQGDEARCEPRDGDSASIFYERLARCEAGCQSSEHRKVEFTLELTGDDMTAMLLDVRSLQTTLGVQPDQSLDSLASEVAEGCWTRPSAYHGCGQFIEECLATGRRPDFCRGFDEARGTSAALERAVEEACHGWEGGMSERCPP